ncbi:hypothetical protein MCAV_03140 [[Mycoplasma] cavipharyngis]|uniref:hypothetical protein n=1 Tax=[Mycoplasma] cavipharyngis TaxID=92757 RepID=UPI003703F55B
MIKFSQSKTRRWLLVGVIATLFLSACSSNNNNNDSNLPNLPPAFDWLSNSSAEDLFWKNWKNLVPRIGNDLKTTTNHLSSVLKSNDQTDFSFPNYSNTDLELFEYLNSRSIGILTRVNGKTNYGTGWILGAATETTKNNKNENSYYLLTSSSIANNFNQKRNSSMNYYRFTFSPFFEKYLLHKEYPGINSLSGLNNNSLRSLRGFNQLEPKDYYQLGFASNQFHWNATELKTKKITGFKYDSVDQQSKTQETITTETSEYQNQKLALNFSVIKVDFNDAYQTAVALEDQGLLNYLSYLREYVAKNNDDSYFNSDQGEKDISNSNNYLVAYPTINQNAIKSVAALNLKVNKLSFNEVVIDPKSSETTDSHLSINSTNNSSFATKYFNPSLDYSISNLVSDEGLGGSVLVRYDPNNSDLKQKFSLVGIDRLKFNVSNSNPISYFSRFIVKGIYDPIGMTTNKNDPNPKTDHSLCNYINQQVRRNPNLRKLSYC